MRKRGELAAWFSLEKTVIRLSGKPSAEIPALNMAGMSLLNLGELPQSESTFRQALDLLEKDAAPDQHQKGRLLHNLGLCLQDAGQLDEAEKSFLSALEIFERFEDAPMTGGTLLNYGSLLLDDKNSRPEQAPPYLRSALGIFISSKMLAEPANTYQNLGLGNPSIQGTF